MDHLNPPPTGAMPPRTPLARPIQDLGAPYHDANAPPRDGTGHARAWRLATFVPAILTTLLLAGAFLDWFRSGGITPTEIALTGLVTVTFFWVAFSVATATVGIVTILAQRRTGAQRPVPAMDVALLIPTYNEAPCDVFGNALAMLEDLRRDTRSGHRYTLFVLSDTRDDAIAAQEVAAFHALRAALTGTPVHYRRRAENTDHKTGNLADWIEGWGGAHDAMLVLDADSLMSGDAIRALTDALSSDPAAGLIQSFPKVIGARSLYGWIQQFSSSVYGTLLSEGLARWSDAEGNFWGHNAILRTQAFAACAGLPHIDGFRARDAAILSHDFVEASLLRRAGWSVRFLPRISGSFEEAPQTLIDYILRDRRWCSGNLQHLRLLASSGFHAISRFHLFHGAVSYLTSPAWFVLLLFWALLGNGENSVLTYFSDQNPDFPLWPVMRSSGGLYMLAFMYAMLLLPKLMGVLSLRATGTTVRALGGPIPFATAILVEMLLSVAYAPVMMVQQTLAVLRVALGIRTKWVPQRRGTDGYPLRTTLAFHALETVTGAALVTGIAVGAVSLWLSPIAASLALAVPLSLLSGLDLSRWAWSRAHLAPPALGERQPVIRAATAYRAHMARLLADPPRDVAAE